MCPAGGGGIVGSFWIPLKCCVTYNRILNINYGFIWVDDERSGENPSLPCTTFVPATLKLYVPCFIPGMSAVVFCRYLLVFPFCCGAQLVNRPRWQGSGHRRGVHIAVTVEFAAVTPRYRWCERHTIRRGEQPGASALDTSRTFHLPIIREHALLTVINDDETPQFAHPIPDITSSGVPANHCHHGCGDTVTGNGLCRRQRGGTVGCLRWGG